MNKNNKIILTNTTGKPVLTYYIYYWDYRPIQPVKTLLYVGKAYNFNNASRIDVYINDIIKNIPAASGYYDILSTTNGIAFYGLNLVSNLEIYVVETNITNRYPIYQDNTKSYIVGMDPTELTLGDVVPIPNTFNTLNKLHDSATPYDAVRQLNFVVMGCFNDDEKLWGLKYVYTDGTTAQHLMGNTELISASGDVVAVKFTCTENYAFDNNPQPSKTVKELWLQYDATNVQRLQEYKFIQFTNDDCEHNVLSFENRNGSISYLQLKGNTIYSESIQRYMKIDMFDKETVYASLVDESIYINTGWLTDGEAKALEDLYVSKKIFLFDATLGKYLAVNLDEGEYKQRQFKNERSLKNYTIKLKLQQKEVL